MKELSLHILDLVENSITANSKLIKVSIEEDIKNDKLIIIIEDNGCGMDEEFLKNVQSPFTTTRTTRSVGLGLSLVKMAANRCEGDLTISSKKNVGTKLEIDFKHSHIDRAPLGDMCGTLICIINNDKNIDLLYNHIVSDKKFTLDTREVKNILEGASITSPEVLLWLKEYIKENTDELYV